MHHICSTCLLLLLISKILKGLDYDNTTLVDYLFLHDDFDCSVIHTWGTDKSKAVIGGVTEGANGVTQFSVNYYFFGHLSVNCYLFFWPILS